MLLGLAALGVVGGIVLLFRGFGGYRSAIRVGDTSTSRISSLAAGEVRLTGTVEPAEVTLTSPLQDRECVWYRSRVDAGEERPVFEEERAIGFRIRDASGTIRVFPRGARIDGPVRLDDRDSITGERPVSVSIRTGPAYDQPEFIAGQGGGHRGAAHGPPARARTAGRRAGRASARAPVRRGQAGSG